VRSVDNFEVARILNRIGDLLDIKGESIHKVLAYRRAAENLQELGEDIHDYQREGRLMDVPGVGKALSEKIDELLTTGHLAYLDRLEDEVPPSLLDVLAIPGVGTKTVHLLWQQLGITDVKSLEQAARSGKLRDLPGLGSRSEARILAGIEALHK
jgi:DNA polymerase (family 10)